MSDSTASAMGAGTSATWDRIDSWSAGTWAVRTRDRLEEVKLRHLLAAFDGARTSDERLAAQQRILTLGSEAIPSVLAELSLSQPPDRADVLLELLVRRESADAVIDLVIRGGGTWALRASLADALARYVPAAPSGEGRLRFRIAAALVALGRDPDVGVRSTAIDAIGLAGIADEPEIHALLEDVAEHDGDAAVQAEARAILGEFE